MRAVQQPIGIHDQFRDTCWGVLAKDQDELDEALKALFFVMPKDSGVVKELGEGVMEAWFRFNLTDKTSVRLDVMAMCAPKVEDNFNFDFCDWTGCWLHNATRMPMKSVKPVFEHVKLFPKDLSGVPNPAWGGVLMDITNLPSTNWVKCLMEVFGEGSEFQKLPKVKDRLAVLFRQPPAAFRVERGGEVTYLVNPAAENLQRLDGGMNYYAKKIAELQREGNIQEIEDSYCLLDPERELLEFEEELLDSEEE